MVDVPMTFGALLIGGVLAVLLSGVTWAQTVVYIKLYPADRVHIKMLVFATWLLDTLHSCFITASLWNYLIVGFGDPHSIDIVPLALALTIVVTAILTFTVQLFFIHRIFILAKRNWLVSSPIAILASARLCFACLTTSRLIKFPSLAHFVETFAWSFTTGLTLSAVVDVLITALMCYLLKRRQQQFSSLNKILDTLILYAFENGILTTVAALLSLITWLTMAENLIFMAAHFVILKFYANSLLATLNARTDLTPTQVTMHTTCLRSAGGFTGSASEAGYAASEYSANVKAPPSAYTANALALTTSNLGRRHIDSTGRPIVFTPIDETASYFDDSDVADARSTRSVRRSGVLSAEHRRVAGLSGAPFGDLKEVGWDEQAHADAARHQRLCITVNTTQVQVVDEETVSPPRARNGKGSGSTLGSDRTL